METTMPEPSFGFSVSKLQGGLLEPKVKVGEILYVLGANGSGKSSLMLLFSKLHHHFVLRISAHRRTWMDSGTHDVSPQQRNNLLSNIQSEDAQEGARWRDLHAQWRVSLAIFNLIATESARARKIAAAVETKGSNVDETLRTLSPLRSLNKILRLSNLPLEISVSNTGDEQVNVKKSGGPEYGIQLMSDGERNALLLAADVLTAKPGTLILIDEPERHLHRSIISPLLSNLFAERPDCAFVVSTHEVGLPLENPKAQIILLHRCEYRGATVFGWDLDLVPANAEIPEDVKRSILGERKRILFIEGTDDSLDKALYSLIFPEASIVARESWHDVLHAVSSIRKANNLHWVKAFGVIDNDNRPTDEVAKLQADGIYALSVFSVESLYYHPEIQRRIAERQSSVNGKDAGQALVSARTSTLAAVKKQRDHLSQRIAEKKVRLEVSGALGNRSQLFANPVFTVSVNTQAILSAEQASLDAAIAAGDLDKIIARYPVRSSGALDKISESLGFPDRNHYESAVLKLMVDDSASLDLLKALFGTLPHDLAAA
jgi:energy-coupling factor transporter ATP-binding protein EcfA2